MGRISAWVEFKNNSWRVRRRMDDGSKLVIGKWKDRAEAEEILALVRNGSVATPEDAVAWLVDQYRQVFAEPAPPSDTAPAGDPPVRGEKTKKKQRPGYEVLADGKIIINRTARTITTDLGEFGEVVHSFEQHAAIRRAYANDWELTKTTIPEVARDHEMHPRALRQYLNLHSITHASDPYTDLEWEEGLEVEDAVSTTLESHRRAFHRKLQQEKLRKLEEDAAKWRRFEETALKPTLQAIEWFAPQYQPPRLILAPPRRSFDVVICPSDLHFGKHGWAAEVGTSYSRAEAERLLLSKTEQLLSTIALYGQPDRIITAVGSDWFHIDTAAGTTTSGTPQDSDGTLAQIIWEGGELAISQLDLLRQIAPLAINFMPGNHDRTHGWGLLHSVACWFRQSPDVTINRSPASRQYLVSGTSLLGFTHGDGAKPQELPLLMANEARSLWGATRHRAWFTGHLHHELTRDISGVVINQLPSLSGSDRWHHEKGFVGARRSLAAYVVDHAQGVVATLYAPVAED